MLPLQKAKKRRKAIGTELRFFLPERPDDPLFVRSFVMQSAVPATWLIDGNAQFQYWLQNLQDLLIPGMKSLLYYPTSEIMLLKRGTESAVKYYQ
jgi:hypothetical protein